MSESCDFLIVGAGIAGLTVAWELRKRDPLVKITILEKEPIVCSPDDAIKAFLQSQWVVLDTFDMFSPEYDNPQLINDVSAMFERYGAEVTFTGFEHFEGSSAAVVRGIKLT